MAYYYCLHCDTPYQESDSIADATPIQFASTYCSLKCYDIDTEQMEADIKAAQILDEALTTQQKEIPLIEQVKVGGFTLNVRKSSDK